MTETEIIINTERERDLVKTDFLGEWNTEFGHASLYSVIGAVEPRVPLNTPVLHVLQSLGQRVADGEPASTVGHAVREEDVLQVALRQAPDVIELVVVVLPQNPEEVVGHENGVVVPHHEPPHVLEAEAQRLRHDPRDADGGAVALLVGVGEVGGVGGDLHWW